MSKNERIKVESQGLFFVSDGKTIHTFADEVDALTRGEAETIGGEAKDGINSTGAGAFWNVLDTGQMLLWHVMLLPLAVGVIVALHVLMVRIRGVVPPFGIEDDGTPSLGPQDGGAR